MRIRFCIALVCAWAAVQPAFGFGPDGHQAIGEMAARLIAGTAAAQQVHELLGDETLATASLWADEVKGHTNQTEEMLRFKAANPGHAVSHYTDIPFQEPRYRDDSIGAAGVDVVHAIPACILILQGKSADQHIYKDVTPREALRLLAHFIGDIHQPLHVGAGYLDKTRFINPNGYTGHYADDQGANRLFYGGTNNLHFYWDITLVQADMARAHARTPAEYAGYLLAKAAPAWETPGPFMDWDRAWAAECLPLSAKIHAVTVTDEDDSQKDYRTGQPRPRWHIGDLSPEYIQWSQDTVEQQMTKAAYRLAATLKAIWPDKK
jgi:hypothetical protein